MFLSINSFFARNIVEVREKKKKLFSFGDEKKVFLFSPPSPSKILYVLIVFKCMGELSKRDGNF